MGCIGAGSRTRPRNWTLTRAVRSFARVVRNWAAQWPWRASHREFPRHSKRREKNWEAPWIQTDLCSRASHPNMEGQAFPDVSWDSMRQQHSSDIIRYHQIIGCVFFDAVALVCLGVAFRITRKNTWRSLWRRPTLPDLTLPETMTNQITARHLTPRVAYMGVFENRVPSGNLT